jgi:hypothetical protein
MVTSRTFQRGAGFGNDGGGGAIGHSASLPEQSSSVPFSGTSSAPGEKCGSNGAQSPPPRILE